MSSHLSVRHERRRSNLESDIAACILISLIILLGYYRVLSGANFFVYEDHFAISNYSFGHINGNGWRPDKGLGISAFFGDAMSNPWSIFALWDQLLHSRTLAYTLSIIFLAVTAAIGVYILARHVLGPERRMEIVVLAPLVVFCFDQLGYYFLRVNASMLAGMCLLPLLLVKFYRRPQWLHLFYGALLLWFVTMLGTVWSLTQILSFGFFFTVLYALYHKPSLKSLALRYLAFHGMAAAIFLLLSCWIWYPLIFEKLFIGYVREKSTGLHEISLLPNVRGIVNFIIGCLPLQGVPETHDLAGINFLPFRFNCSVLFPFVLISILFRRAQDFWVFVLRWLMVIFLVHNFLALSNLLPGYGQIYAYLSNKTTTLVTMYLFIFPVEVALLIIWFVRLSPENVVLENRWGRGLQKVLAVLIGLFYAGMLVPALMAVLAPQGLKAAVQIIVAQLPATIAGYSKDLIALMLLYNTDRFVEVMHWSTVIFFVTSFLIAGVFLKNSWLKVVAGLPKIRVAVFLLINALMLSWSIYPLNTKMPVWQQPAVESMHFQPTDRFYFIRNDRWEKTVKEFHRRMFDQQEPRRRQIGLLEPPGLNISGLKSFTTQAEGDFMFKVFNGDGVTRMESLRLYYGGPLLISPLLNMSAVNYYYSDAPLTDLPAELTLYAQTRQLYVYKNAKAWPYYYLARRLARNDGHLREPVEDTAYIAADDLFALDHAPSASVRLNEFRFGHLKFSFDSPREEFLVIADAWHPFWKATAQGRSLPIVKANDLFKGVRLPAGHYDVTFDFNTAPFRYGVWATFAAWLLFLIALWAAVRKPRAIRFLEG